MMTATITGDVSEDAFANSLNRIRDVTSEVEGALTRTGGVITSAGLTLAGTFSPLMTLPLQDLFQPGFSVAIGVLMDTFITRTLMVASIVSLFGRWNWWPSSTSRVRREGQNARAAASSD